MEGACRQGLVVVLLFLASLSSAEAPTQVDVESQFQPGDLIFRRGTGIVSDFARNFSSGERRFSHVGLVAERDRHQVVVHAIYDRQLNRDGVVSDSVVEFLDGTADWALYRVALPDSRRERIADVALEILDKGLPFDNQFSLVSADSLYCTEFIWRVVNDVAGRELIRPSIASNDTKIVAIWDVYSGPEMQKVVERPTDH